jgi:DNA-binding NarL/FixJ family response regulator
MSRCQKDQSVSTVKQNSFAASELHVGRQMPNISVLVVDDERLLAGAIASLCERVPGVRDVVQAFDGLEAIKIIEELAPNVAIVDILLPNINGIEIAAHVKAKRLSTRIILLTGCPDHALYRRGLHADAAGYLLKGSAVEELPIAIEAVVRGDTYITPQVATTLIDIRRGLSDREPTEHLTPRQRQVLQLIAEGKTSKEIAGLLQIAVKTVTHQRMELMRRLSVHDTAALVRFAIRNKFIDINKD